MAKNQTPHAEPVEDGTAAAAATLVSGGIDQVRDIIFGPQMAAYERRFNELESKLNADMQQTRKQLTEAVQSLEKALEAASADQSKQLKEERAERSKAQDYLTAQLEKEAEAARNHTDDAASEAAQDREALRQSLAESVRRLEEALESRFEQMKDSLSQASGDLGHRKTDRSFLAALLKDTAERLERD